MPNRILKESICTSETIDQLSAFEETFFYRLLVNCDDYGLMDARPAILKARLYPLKEIRLQQIEDALRKLTSAELVSTYEVNGKPFLLMNTWDRHQQIRAAKAKYPGPDGKYPSGGVAVKRSDIIRYQMKSSDSKCSRNPIQSYSESESYSGVGSAGAREEPESPQEMAAAAYCDLCLRGMSPGNYEELRTFIEDGLPDDLIRFAVDDACSLGNRTWAYVAKILNRYVVQGIKTVDQARADKKDHDKKASQQKGRKTVSAQQYEQRDYAPGELDAMGEDLMAEARKIKEQGSDNHA